MSALTARRAGEASVASKAAPWGLITGMAALAATGLVCLMYWPVMLDVWRTGVLLDTDDAMRLVQVRAFLAGQPWFDMTAYRLDPPTGSVMHWTRLVDAPLAILIQTFALVVDQARAEILARLVFPLALLVGLFAAVARLAAILHGPVARLPAIVTTLFCGGAIVQFQPGRIDHHTPQVLLLVLMAGSAALALDPAKARHATVAGALVALSLATNLENLPFLVCLAGLLVAHWIWHGASMAGMLRAFGLGLLVALVPAFAITVAPDQWLAPVCDAFGAAHLGAGLIGAAGCVGLAALSPRLPGRAPRLVAAGFVAGAVLAYVAACYPACLHDPFARVDPLVREIWISNVTESQPFLRFFAKDPTGAALFMLPVVLGSCGCLGAALVQKGLLGQRYLLLAGLSAMGTAMAFWQIRCFTTVTPVAIMGALPLAIALHRWLDARGRDLMALLALCCVFPFTSLAWGMVLPDSPIAAKPATACLAAASFAPLAALPQGRVVAPIDSGAHLLAYTDLDVFSAPYHRDNDGNRFALDAMLAPPARALAMLAARETAYVLICPGFGETEGLAKRAPDGLAATLLAGRVPTGLTRLTMPGTPYWVFSLERPKK